MIVIAGLFGHRRPPDPFYVQWFHAATQWTSVHWPVLAVVIPVAGAIAAGVVNHYLALARENRSRRLTRGDARARVYADLAARLLAHCAYLQNAWGTPAFDPGMWRAGNAGLRARAEMTDVIDVLGADYVSFMAAIERERRIVERLTADGAQGRREVLALYARFISQFGERTQARRLERYAAAGR